MKSLTNLLWLALAFLLTACTAVPVSFGPTVTPSTTSTPLATHTPTATATLPPPPTPLPITRIQTGEQALFYGDFETARLEFGSAYRESDDSQVRAAALWGFGRVEYADNNLNSALTSLRQLLAEFPESTFTAYTNFLLGEIYSKLERHREAADAYRVYLELRPGVLDSYAYHARGDNLVGAQDYNAALSAYTEARSAPKLEDDTTLDIKIAQTRARIGDYASAISAYEAIAAATANDFVKAQMDYQIGQARQALGQQEQAQQVYLHAVENYPLSYYSYLSLVELVEAGVQVSDLDRGLVDYFAAQYTVALVAFDRYLEDGLDTDGTARYYRALTLRELQNHAQAVQELSTFIAGYPNHPRWTNAWSEKAAMQWIYLRDYLGASQTLLDFVAAAPTQPEAAEALMNAARILERDNRLEEAAGTWQRVADEYPDSPDVPQALFLAGIMQFRRGDYHQALPIFQRGLILSTTPADQARAYLWIGKTHEKLDDDPAAKLTAWQQAAAADPTGYYSERAADLLIGRAPFEAPASYNIAPDLETERRAAISWMRVTFSLPPETDLSTPGSLAGDLRFVRGTEFWELGLYENARLEFESLREEVSDSPADSFRLANYLLDLGLYRAAIFASRQVLTLAGLDAHASSLNAPVYFNRIRYGTYYADLVVPRAEANDLHPLFLFSVMRQESLFEGFVRSTAGARGLLQIIPSTGASLAQTLAWPPLYEADDLYRPNVSVRLGTYYLSNNRSLLGGDYYAALAAYNAGPGNAAAWNELAGDDPDLFLEIVRFQETRNYIRLIYEIYNIYRGLYSPAQ